MRLWPRGGLWRHGDFLRLWTAETISQVGSQFSGLALPLVAILVLDVSAFEVALLGTIGFAPFILFSLPAGVWVDRLPRKPILVLADVARAGALLTVPAAHFAGVLTIWQLFAVAFAVGIGTVFFDVAYQSYLPSLVEREQLVEGNSKLEISRSGAQIGGPGLAGGAIQLLTAPVAVLADALSFLASAAFLARIRRVEVVQPRELQAPKPRMRSEVMEGLRYVLGHPLLRPIAACTGLSNFFGSMIFAILLVFAVRELGLAAGLIGLVLSIGNVGFLVGALTANRISGRIGIGRTILGAALVFGPAMLLFPLASVGYPLVFLVGGVLLGGFGGVVYNINQLSLRQAITPERMLGRMNSVIRFVVWGTIPLGSLLGGALATRIGLAPTMWIAAAGACFAFVPVALSAVPRIARIPEPAPEVTTGQAALEGAVAAAPLAPATPDT